MYWVHWDALGCIRMQWDAMGCSGKHCLHWDVLGRTGTQWDTLGCTETYWDAAGNAGMPPCHPPPPPHLSPISRKHGWGQKGPPWTSIPKRRAPHTTRCVSGGVSNSPITPSESPPPPRCLHSRIGTPRAPPSGPPPAPRGAARRGPPATPGWGLPSPSPLRVHCIFLRGGGGRGTTAAPSLEPPLPPPGPGELGGEGAKPPCECGGGSWCRGRCL